MRCSGICMFAFQAEDEHPYAYRCTPACMSLNERLRQQVNDLQATVNYLRAQIYQVCKFVLVVEWSDADIIDRHSMRSIPMAI